MDDGHRAQFAAVAALEQAIARGADIGIVRGLLAGLIERTQVHFAEELALMRDSGYPGSDLHAREHRRLLGQLRNVEMNLGSGQVELAHELMRTLTPWVSEHIDTMDRALARHLRSLAPADEPGR